ncbi:hypothetical protein HK101_011803 [Irineochytrium annulatum]|nr:hypothetical protein HK101_011803 [Irineochytrium annulatum]
MTRTKESREAISTGHDRRTQHRVPEHHSSHFKKDGAGQANWGIPGEELEVDLDQEGNIREEHLKGDMIREGTTVKIVGEKEFRAAKEAMSGK